MFQAMRADRIVFALRGCVGELGVGNGREKVGERGFVVKKESDSSCVEPKLNGYGYLGCGRVVGIDEGLECSPAEVGDVNMDKWRLIDV